MMLLLILKLESEVLEVVKVEENEYKDNNSKDVANQRQGKLIRKIWRRRAIVLSLKKSALKP